MTAMESSGTSRNRPKGEDVISKLKDDGDFDALRLKLVRKIKENEDLRSLIISEVKQSATLNREGAENLKPRQLSDAIHEEIGNKVMGHISDELWRIIRSGDGMRDEIRNSVKSVFDELINPGKEKTNTLSSSNKNLLREPPGDEPKAAPPGLFPFNPPQMAENSGEESAQAAGHHHNKEDELRSSPVTYDGPPNVIIATVAAAPCDAEEDPDVPPGFG